VKKKRKNRLEFCFSWFRLEAKINNRSKAKNLKQKKQKSKKSKKSEKKRKKVKKCEKKRKKRLEFRFALFHFEAKMTKAKSLKRK
jgi:hypothetical protein